MDSYVRVRVPVADLRGKPVEAAPLAVRDDMRVSQLLFNELLAVKEEQGGWLAVEAVEQQKLTPDGWHGYPGWVRKVDVTPSDGTTAHGGVVKTAFATVRSSPSADSPAIFPLSLGTRLFFSTEARGFLGFSMEDGKTGWVPKGAIGLSPPDDRARPGEVVRIARLFLGATYLWGGRSMPMPWPRGPVMGVDCSGLVNLVFRAVGVDLPRDAHDQWKKTAPVRPPDSVPGDLIFVKRPGEAEPVSHVMLFIGGERFIEATETGDSVRVRTFSQKFRLSLKGLAKGGTADRNRVYFGKTL
ncbi:MAG: NlpC/P60 family protein [Syntrophorhabdales bacterium]|jgi:cell wall-associated NlpC family hydrolase